LGDKKTKQKKFEGPLMENADIFYSHSEYATDIWEIL
jgi:hypothetical protein